MFVAHTALSAGMQEMRHNGCFGFVWGYFACVARLCHFCEVSEAYAPFTQIDISPHFVSR